MPLARAALYGQGEDLHIACWPGNMRNTEDLTPILAKEGRSYCVSVSSIMTPNQSPLPPLSPQFSCPATRFYFCGFPNEVSSQHQTADPVP